MNTLHVITIIAVIGSHFAAAQNVMQDPKPDPVLDAIQDLSNSEQGEIPAEPLAEEGSTLVTNSESDSSVISAPVLVTGKPPEGEIADASVPASEEAAVTTEEDEASKPEKGLIVRVEKLHVGNGSIDPSQVKLLAPYPAKPLSSTPVGWHLDASNNAPAFTREVEISPGSKITLSIRPHMLVPDADGEHVFTISEPGYDNALGYQQSSTVGAILSNSVRQLDEESKQLGAAIENLQQLLISLPKPELQDAAPAKPLTNRKK